MQPSPSADANGDDTGPWTVWLPYAWQSVADPRGTYPAPDWSRSPDHLALCARWGPLLHLLIHGLGWSRPDLGMARWLEMGRPDDDPILRLVNQWYGDDVLDLLAWADRTDSLLHLGQQISSDPVERRLDETRLRTRSARPWAARPISPPWGDDGDPLHLTTHVLSPLTIPESGMDVAHVLLEEDGEPRRALTVLGHYQGWYVTLPHYGLRKDERGRSWRTDVIVKPVGWLGEYRWSHETGAWFRGRHRWHTLGA